MLCKRLCVVLWAITIGAFPCEGQSPITPSSPPRFDAIFADTRATSFRIDAPNGVIYVSFRDRNRVDKVSLATLEILGSVEVYDAGPIDLSPDGASLYVASATARLLFKVRLSDLRVTDRYVVSSDLDYTGSTRLCATLDGRVFLTGAATGGHSAAFDVATQSFSRLELIVPGDPSDMACSADHRRVVFSNGFSPSWLTVYDAGVQGFSAFHRMPNGSSQLAINTTGDRILSYSMNPSIGGFDGVLLDENLTPLSSMPSRPPTFHAASFSPNGAELVLWQSETLGGGGDFSQFQNIRVVDGRTGKWKRDTRFFFQDDTNSQGGGGIGSSVAVADDLGRLFVRRPQGLGVFDTTQAWGNSIEQSVYLRGVTPRIGSTATSTEVTVWRSYLNDFEFKFQPLSNPEIFIDGRQLTGVTRGAVQNVAGGLAVPMSGSLPALIGGRAPAMVTLRWPGFALAVPFAFSAGCWIQQAMPAAVLPGKRFFIQGFGFPLTPGQTQVTVGGVSATVVEPVQLPYPTLTTGLMSIEAIMPAGTASGALDINLTVSGQTCSKQHAMTALISETFVPLSAKFGQMAYDAGRHRLYLSSQEDNLVRVINTDTGAPLSSFNVGAIAFFLAMSPDGASLAVLTTAGLVIIDLQSGTSAPVVTLPSGPPFDPRLAASSNGTFFVGDNEFNPVTKVFTKKVNPATGFGAGDVIASSPNGKTILFGVSASSYLYDSDSNTGVSYRSFLGSNSIFSYSAVSDDGNVIALSNGEFDSRLNPIGSCKRPGFALNWPIIKSAQRLNAAGSLMYVPTDNGFDICDVLHSRVVYRGILSVEPSLYYDARDHLAIDETGKKIFVSARNGLVIITLARLPLALGHLEPKYLLPGQATPIVVRGSGFQPGITATLDGIPLSATFVDEETLQISVTSSTLGNHALTFTNPDGETTTYALALRVVESLPVITAISPDRLDLLGSLYYKVSIYGAGFRNGYVARWNGTAVTTQFLSPGLLLAEVPGSSVVHGSVNTVTVFDPVQEFSSNSKTLSVPGPAGFRVTPGLIRFGPQLVSGTPIANYQALSLHSQGNISTPITAITVSGPFFLVDQGCSATLSPYARCTALIGFKPTALGSADGTLVIHGPEGTTLATVPLHGVAIDLMMSVERPARPRRSLPASSNEQQSFRVRIETTQSDVEGIASLACEVSTDLKCELDASEFQLGSGPRWVTARINSKRVLRLRKVHGPSFGFIKVRVGGSERVLRLPI